MSDRLCATGIALMFVVIPVMVLAGVFGAQFVLRVATIGFVAACGIVMAGFVPVVLGDLREAWLGRRRS